MVVGPYNLWQFDIRCLVHLSFIIGENIEIASLPVEFTCVWIIHALKSSSRKLLRVGRFCLGGMRSLRFSTVVVMNIFEIEITRLHITKLIIFKF